MLGDSASEIAELAGDRSAITDSSNGSGAKRNELRRGIEQRNAGIVELDAQASKQAEIHQRNLEACRIIQERCMVPRSQTEDDRYQTEVARLSEQRTQQLNDRKELQSQIDKLVN